MNSENWEETDDNCNVCGDAIEIGTATSRCSNRRCPTRDRDCPLGTTSSPKEVHEYHTNRDVVSMDKIESVVTDAYRDYEATADTLERERAAGKIQMAIELGVRDSWGAIAADVAEGPFQSL